MLDLLDTFIAFAVVMLGVSVIITIITQILTTIFGMRASNLRWGLQRLLESADPKLRKFAEEIAGKVLCHPLITSTHRRAATVVRKEEFIDVLDDLANRPESSLTPEAQQALKDSLAVHGMRDARILRWFNTVMDRVSERFAKWARSLTVISSFIIAFAIHLDAIALLNKFSTDKALRSNFVQISSTILEQSKSYLESPLSSTSSIFSEAFERLKEKIPAAADLPAPPAFRYAADAELWLRKNLADSLKADVVVKDFSKLVLDISSERAQQLRQTAFAINDSLRSTSFQLIPRKYGELKYGWREILGMLISGALLSLGAPFWYNSLGNLANLRPVLVRKERQEREKSAA